MSNQNQGAYVPTTLIFDVAQLYSTDVTSPEFKELLVRLYQYVNNIALVLNVKDTAYYNTLELLSSQSWFPNPALTSTSTTTPVFRPGFRRVFNIGPLGPGVTAVNHNLPINAAWQFTRIYGVANDNIGNNYYPLPWASAAGATNIELRVNLTQIIITNNSGIVFTSCLIILEWIES